MIAAEQQDLADLAKAAARSRRERFEAEIHRALDAGFDEREAPWVASARLLRGPTTVKTMRAHLRAACPWLYEDIES